MADNTDGDEPGGRVYNFPRLGFQLTPTTVMDPPAAPPNPSATDPNAVTVPSIRVRRSPLDIVNALPAPGALQPFTPGPTPAPAPQPGQVPDTFRSEPAGDMVGPRLGALGLAATLAIAVAALRGTHTMLSTWWENRQARNADGQALREARAKHHLAMQQAGFAAQQASAKHQAALHGIGQKAAQDRAKQNSKVPHSSEFGRKTLGRNNAGPGGAKPNNQQPKPAPKPVPKPNQINQKKPTALDDKKKPLPPKQPLPHKAPHRSSQGANDTLKKHQRPDPRKDRTTLPQALKKHVNDAAQKRLEQRRNNDIKPVLRKNTPKQQDKTPVNLKKAPKGPATPQGPGSGKGNGQQGTTTPNAKKTPQQPNSFGHAIKQGVQKAAARRWKRRHKNGQQQPVNLKKTPKVNLKKGPKQGPGNAQAPGANKQQQAKARNQARWKKARDYLKKKTTNGGATGGTQQAPGAGQGAQQGPQSPGGGSQDFSTPNGAGQQQRRRKSPFENAGQATGTTWTVESEHVPGSRAKRWEPDALTTGTPALPSTGPAALDTAPLRTPPRPGTSRPKEPIPMPPTPARREDPRITRAKKQAARTGGHVIAQARHMDGRHQTEITLDDALDQYGEFAADGFKTHDQAVKLARRAIKLRDTLAVFAEQLATENNLIGTLFTGAMARMSESMDLVARMAEEMQTSSLEAAEMAEGADNELNDAYRPFSTATADAGLAVPSAPVHNQA